MNKDLAAVLRELEKLNQAHGGTVIAHLKALCRVRAGLMSDTTPTFTILTAADATSLTEAIQVVTKALDEAETGSEEATHLSTT